MALEKHLILFFSLLQMTNYLSAQNSSTYIPYRKGDKWGFCDSTKKITVSPIYDSVSWFFNLPASEIAIVKKNGKLGLVNKAGKIALPIVYSKIITDNYILNGEKYERQLILVNGRRYYKYDSKRSVAIAISDQELPSPVESLRAATIDCNSVNGQIEIVNISSEGRIILKKFYSSNAGNLQYYSADSIVIAAQQISKVPCSVQFLFAKSRGMWGLITVKGNTLIANDYDSIYQIRRDLVFAGRKNDKWDLFWVSDYPRNDTGGVVSRHQSQYDEIQDVGAENYFVVRKGEYWGIVMSHDTPAVFLDTVLYSKYIDLYDLRLVGVYNSDSRLVGYISYNGRKYWD